MTYLAGFLESAAVRPAVLLVAAVACVGLASGQAPRKSGASEEPPLFHEYRGVAIGWATEDVRKKLGAPATKSDEQDYYEFGEKERAQILYDQATHKVTAISVDFMNGASTVLTPQQVFGAEIDAKPDGSKYKLVRYPKAGYWVSYSRTAGDSPIISVTLQRIAQ